MRRHHWCRRVLHSHRECARSLIVRRIPRRDRHYRRPNLEIRSAVLRIRQAGHAHCVSGTPCCVAHHLTSSARGLDYHIRVRRNHGCRRVTHGHRESPRALIIGGVTRSDCHRGRPDWKKCAAVLRIGDRRVRRSCICRTSRCVSHNGSSGVRRLGDHIGMCCNHRSGRVLHSHRECARSLIVRRILCSDCHRGRPDGKKCAAVLGVCDARHTYYIAGTSGTIVHKCSRSTRRLGDHVGVCCNHRGGRVHHVHYACRAARGAVGVRRTPCHCVGARHICHYRIARNTRRAGSVLHIRCCRSGIGVSRGCFKCQRVRAHQ